MAFKATQEQLDAIDARGKIIVSASAGSGKTAVMIERLVSLILSGEDVRRVLCMTFTNKAAAQMREKLRRALIKKIGESEGEERKRLKEQLAFLPLAEISTIHAFCARLVRSNFFLVDTDPAFKIISADDAEGKAISLRALDEVFEQAYARGDEDFLNLLSVYFRTKKDSQLRAAVLSIYSAVRGIADYKKYFTDDHDYFGEACRYLFSRYQEKIKFCLKNSEELSIYFFEKNEKAQKVAEDILRGANYLFNTNKFFEMVEISHTLPKISVMPPTTKAEGEEKKKLLFLKNLSQFIKELYKELAKFGMEEEEYLKYSDAKKRMLSLGKLALLYDELYSAKKREAGVLDYDDLEHGALSVLKDERVCAELKKKYTHIFIDEYQDVNPVQEKILSLLGGDDIFLVGDAKQSIYSFRGSRSKYFIDKINEFPISLDLSENFRSAPAVIEAVNRVFTRIMTEDICGIDYIKHGFMRGGNPYGEHAGEVVFHRVEQVKKEKTERGIYSVLSFSGEEADPQAEQIIQIISSEIGTDWYDAQEGRVKQIGYGDIAVLARKTKSKDVQKIVAALSKANIPVTTTAKVNVCDYWEARLVIDWLSYLDNAEQDIPMAGAMLSRLGMFNESELAQIRLRFPSPYAFRDACREYARKMADGTAQKLKTFFERCSALRALLPVKGAGEMIGLLLLSGLQAEIAAKKDGAARLRRVARLSAAAEEMSVNAFLRRLKAVSYEIDFSEAGGEDAVKVLTMHAVKGLEYPVVILASLDTPFHGAETGDVLFSERFGFAPRSYDVKNRIAHSTLLRYACMEEQIEDELKGEINLFYVAMTRAKYRLHLLFGGKGDALSPRFAKRFSDFVDKEDCDCYFIQQEQVLENPVPRMALGYTADEALKEAILANYCKPYAFSDSILLPVKSSATEISKQELRSGNPFAQANATSSVEEGLAYHAFLEHVAFGKGAAEELARMRKECVLNEKQLALIDPEKAESILNLPSIKALTGKDVRRECKFLISLPAQEIPVLKTQANDNIILQGAIDLLYEDEAGYLILDYKYSAHEDERIRADYATQLLIYRKAVAKITGVSEKSIRARILNICLLREIEM